MCEYIPTDTDVSELGDFQDDYNNLLQKYNSLSTENESLNKKLKDEIFERDNKIQSLIFENDKLKSSLDSANDLLGFFQSQDNSKYKKINEQLSARNFELEQINHNLKRENFTLKSEKEEIKLEIDKIKSLRSKEKDSIDMSNYSTFQISGKVLDTKDFNSNSISNSNSQNYNSNSMPEKKKEFKEKFLVEEKLSENDLNLEAENDNNNNQNDSNDSIDSSYGEYKSLNGPELRKYVRKTKKESKNFYKKALEMLTENELEMIKLRTENEQLKENNNPYMSNSNINNSLLHLKSDEILKDSDFSEEEIKKILEENKMMKYELSDKDSLLEHEKNIFNIKMQQMESSHRLAISEMENEIYKLKSDIENLELEKNIIEKDLDRDSYEKTNMAQDLEKFNQMIRNLEEQKDRNENNNKILIENLTKEKNYFEKMHIENSEIIMRLEKDVKMLKENEKKIINEGKETLKKEKYVIERETKEIRNNLIATNKEKDLLKKELEAIKINFKTIKSSNVEMTQEIKSLRDSNISENKKLVDKYENIIDENERKFFDSRFSYEEKIKELMSVIDEAGLEYKENNTNNSNSKELDLSHTDLKSGRNSIKLNEIIRSNTTNNNQGKNNNLIQNFNIDNLNREIELLRSKNFKLDVEINNLNSKLKIKENKIANTIRLKNEIETLKKEKLKYKSDIFELKQLYEEQINELLQKLENNKNINNYNSNNNNESEGNSNNNNESQANNNKISKEEFDELKNDLLKVKYEKKFILEKNEILTRELENMEKLKNEYIKKLKEDLELAENLTAQAKLNVGQIVFEKDTEIVKYKKICKKWKTKYQNLQLSSNFKGQEFTPSKSYISNSSVSISNYGSSTKNIFEMKENNGNVSSSKEYSTNAPNVNSSSKKSFFDKIFN